LDYVPLVGALFAFGVVSVYAGAGESRLQDYMGEEAAAIRVYSYGSTLLLVTVPLTLAA